MVTRLPRRQQRGTSTFGALSKLVDSLCEAETKSLLRKLASCHAHLERSACPRGSVVRCASLAVTTGRDDHQTPAQTLGLLEGKTIVPLEKTAPCYALLQHGDCPDKSIDAGEVRRAAACWRFFQRLMCLFAFVDVSLQLNGVHLGSWCKSIQDGDRMPTSRLLLYLFSYSSNS